MSEKLAKTTGELILTVIFGLVAAVLVVVFVAMMAFFISALISIL